MFSIKILSNVTAKGIRKIAFVVARQTKVKNISLEKCISDIN